jgi:hypothetical protein
MITFITHLKVRPENGPVFEALMTHVRDMTRQHEPGVAYYDPANEGELRWPQTTT